MMVYEKGSIMSKKQTRQEEFTEHLNHLVDEGVQECALAAKQKSIKNNATKKNYFSGCKLGFRLSRKVICLEQLERLLITYSKQEHDILKNIRESYKFENLFNKNISKANGSKVKILSKIKGIRSSINYVYDSLNILIMSQKMK